VVTIYRDSVAALDETPYNEHHALSGPEEVFFSFAAF